MIQAWPIGGARMRHAYAAMIAAGIVSLIVLLAPVTARAVPMPVPALTGLASSTHPTDTVWYKSPSAAFQWVGAATLTGYSFALDRNPTTPGLDLVTDGLKPSYAPGVPGYLEPTKTWMPDHVVQADFNNDGKQDLVWAGGFRAFVQLGNGDGTFNTLPTYLEPQYLASIQDMAVGDFNGDGIPDLAFALHSNNVKLAVMLGNGNGTFQSPLFVTASDWWTGRAVTAADFDGDGILELALAYDQIDSGLSVFDGVGNGTFSTQTTYAVPGGYPANWVWGLTSGDLNADGHPDIVATCTNGDKVVVYTNDGSGGFSAPPTSLAVGVYPGKSVIADLDSDGRPDIVTANQGGTDEPVTALMSNSDGTYTRRAIPSANYAQFTGMVVKDMNLDGTPDIVGFNRYSYTGESTIDVLYNDGTGAFPRKSITPGYSNARRAIAAGDYDGDSIPDVVVCRADDNAIIPLLASPGAELAVPGEGVWYFHVRGVKSGAGGPISDMKILVDTTGPGVALSGAADGGAYLPESLPSASIVASDPNMPDASGVSEIHWSSSAGESGVVAGASAPITIPTAPGVYWWMAHAVDNIGNEGISRTFYVTVLGDVAGLASPSHPDAGHWYPAGTAEFVWDVGQVNGFSFSIDRDPNGVPDLIADDWSSWGEQESQGSTTVAGLAPGTWYFHIRQVGEGAGARVSTIRVNIRAAGVASVGTVRFTGDSSKLTPRAKARIRAFAAFIESRDYTTVCLDGYAARRSGGSAAFRKRLSKARAVAVQAYLDSCLRGLGHKVAYVTTGRGAVPGSRRLSSAHRKVVVSAK